MSGAVVDEVLRKMENAADMGIKAADDYMDSDTGLLMCGKCRTKKQKKIAFLGEERIVGCLCRCAAEEVEKERERHRAEEELLRVQQMKSAGLQDKTFYNYTFGRCDASQENAVYAKRYVEHFSEMAHIGQGLLFWGNVGTGKTFLAGCIANALLEMKIPVLMTSFPKILNALGGLYSAERNEYLAVFSHKGGSVRRSPGVPSPEARQRPARSVRILWRFCLYPAFPLSPKQDRQYTSCPRCPASRSSVRGWYGLTAAHRAALRYMTSPFSAENRDKGKTAALRCRL